MKEIGEDYGKRYGLSGELCLLDEPSFIENRRGSFGEGVGKKIPRQKASKKKEKIIGDRDLDEVAEDKTNN
jgi:hypothetical protein